MEDIAHHEPKLRKKLRHSILALRFNNPLLAVKVNLAMEIMEHREPQLLKSLGNPSLKSREGGHGLRNGNLQAKAVTDAIYNQPVGTVVVLGLPRSQR